MASVLTNDTLDEWYRKHFFPSSAPLGAFADGDFPVRFIEGGEGSTIRDRDGNSYLDGFGGLYCVNVGYNNRHVIEAMKKQADNLSFYHTFAGQGHESAARLAKMVSDRAPSGLSRVYFGFGGSDANDTIVKMIWYYFHALGKPEKRKVIARDRAYHGSGLVSGSLTGLHGFHKNFGLPFESVLRTRGAYYYRREDMSMSEEEYSRLCGEDLELLIEREGSETIAAFIAEPMMGTGGIVPPPRGYWGVIEPILRRHDILLVSDEVVNGFGRLGSMFGCSHYGIEVDAMAVAKGLTSAYAPLSASIFSDKIWEVLVDGNRDQGGPFGHAWTYAAHPISCAAGVANLEALDNENLIENVREVGSYFVSLMKEALSGHRYVGDVRGEGMLCAVELVKDKESRIFFENPTKVATLVTSAMARRGVVARAMPAADIIGFAPPFCLTKEEAARLVEVTLASVEEVSSTL
jgi:L-2,4-diaminobutyrate transaminase